MTLLTKRHFEYLAATLRTLPLPARERAVAVKHFVKAMQLTNPKFDSGRFITACGLLSADIRYAHMSDAELAQTVSVGELELAQRTPNDHDT